MKDNSPAIEQAEHAELLLLPDGRILAHSIGPVMAAILAILEPHNEPITRRAGLYEKYADQAGN